ncbi:hypothetical protein CEUSTIGMA_g9429.t1 [Chlamydomonas eustigma]|uniref:HECT domain-containing protein n=1 Tax=Chlamydomonas eustigma TaxID=1157962 RepID=A0A250XG01_9CHLO|nr:hypothetical protein CEUSTIGMA_g9429.t1 [Chlamydomonas eustigma]|eukprot:GAX82001.1 hypothetical protein CEUSTIGMA_g9429.t1 [Chlamydomonas eustigma]
MPLGHRNIDNIADPGLGLTAVRTKAVSKRLMEIQAEDRYAVSPSTPLLSTHISENSYVCGNNHFGQLGILACVKVHEPQLMQGAGPWATVAYGGQHAAGLTSSGQLYMWGTNTKGQLGLNSKGRCVSAPTKIDLSDQTDVRAVACGEQHTIVTTGSDVMSCGSNEHGQLGYWISEEKEDLGFSHMLKPIPSLHNMSVVQVVCGSSHTLCVTAQSQVYAWGSNSSGQLGLGDKKDRAMPILVDALWALPVVQLAAGSSHSLALTKNGHIFAWGSNDSGQLGLLPDAEHAAPTYSSPMKERRVVTPLRRGHEHSQRNITLGSVSSSNAAASSRRTHQYLLMTMLEMGIPRPQAELALEETGYVGVEVATEWLFTLTSHVLNQHLAEREASMAARGTSLSFSAGHKSVAMSEYSTGVREEVRGALEPRRVPLTHVRNVAAGSFHTVAVTDFGVYGWGDNSCGALGLGDTEDRDLPCKVDTLDDYKVCSASCGSSHTLFLTQDGSVLGCGDGASGQLTQRADQMGISNAATLPFKLALPFGVQRTQSAQCKAPVVHEVVAGPATTAFITRSPDDLPDVQQVMLLNKLQNAVDSAYEQRGEAGPPALKDQQYGGRTDGPNLFKAVSSGVEAVFSYPAALNAAFGRDHGVGLDVMLLDKVQTSILDLYSCKEEQMPSSGTEAVADLHKFSICQTMYRAASTLLDDLSSHLRLLGGPERAQVLLAVCQHPLLSDHSFAKLLIPRLGGIFMNSPAPTRQLLVKWWSEYPADVLLNRVVLPLESYLSKELMATKKLTVSVMNAIKMLAKVEEANQIGRALPPDAFYNQLISEKMDVQDHYTAWRQTRDMPAMKRTAGDGPFSFCSYPFLLDPRAKSNLLHIEARFQMEQTVAHARMEQQLHGGSARHRSEADSALVLTKSAPSTSSSRGASAGGSSSSTSSSESKKKSKEKGLRGLLMALFRSSSSTRSRDDAAQVRDQVAVSVDSFSLPLPMNCNMPGSHSDMCILRVRRNHLVEDALSEISRQLKRDLFKPLRVHFIGEEGIDAGGVKKEFFQLLVTQLLSPDYGMLRHQPESNTYWFDANSLEGPDQYMLLGLILGLAVYNRVLLDFPLPLPLYKKLLGQPVGLRDLEDMQPTFGRSLRQLLQFDGPPGTLEDTFCVTFSFEVERFGQRHVVELLPHGDRISVTEDNRLEYVEAVVDFLLNKSIDSQFTAFSEGFRILCDGPATRLFNAQVRISI